MNQDIIRIIVQITLLKKLCCVEPSFGDTLHANASTRWLNLIPTFGAMIQSEFPNAAIRFHHLLIETSAALKVGSI